MLRLRLFTAMKILGSTLVFATLFTAAPAIALSPSAPDGTAAHRAYALIGMWSCESVAHSTGTVTFTRNDDGSIAMKNVFKTAIGTPGEFQESYNFDPAKKMWNWTSTYVTDPEITEVGTAPEWLGDTWVFDGSFNAPKAQTPERMVYTLLGDTAFKREFEVKNNDGNWTDTSAETCTRATP